MAAQVDRHVAVIAFPFASHPGALFGLVKRLAGAASHVTFTFIGTAKSNNRVFTKASEIPSNVRRYDVPDGLPEGFAGRVEEEIGMFFRAAPENLRKALATLAESSSGGKIACVMADTFVWFSGEIAAEIGASWVPVWNSAAGALLVHVYTDMLREEVGCNGISGREDEIVTFVPGFPEIRLGDLPEGIVSGNLDSPVSIMLYNMVNGLKKATALPINSFEELHPSVVDHLRKKLPQALNLGPFNATSLSPTPSTTNTDDRYDSIAWLDKQKDKSVVYLAFGNMATPPPDELVAIAEALEETKTPFLWSLGDNFSCHLPKGFLERTMEYGKIVPWTPQLRVLSHTSVAVFINHGGWNSVIESIDVGVPMICRPGFGDNYINVWMVDKVWGIGVRIENGVFTKDRTKKALEMVLVHENGKELRSKVCMYKQLLQESLGPNGSSTQNFENLLKIITSEKL